MHIYVIKTLRWRHVKEKKGNINITEKGEPSEEYIVAETDQQAVEYASSIIEGDEITLEFIHKVAPCSRVIKDEK